ncbi:4Fe-4S dicluster domain-containing protein [Winogradskyella sp.]|uniref:4Fe-4S binding protein n=1 Tax=Winogradskyella sp. TaxID=1883156 RepID=UPI0025EE1B04|nr:4Fe-4S dicluster domain-containing protein [Winogradskyella sp.]
MSNKLNHSMSLAKPDALDITTKQKVALVIGVIGLFILALALFNTDFPNKGLFLSLSLGFIAIGIIVYSREAYLNKLEGIKNDGQWFKSISSRGVWGWIVGVILTGFYIVLYFYEELLGLGQGVNGINTGLIALFDPLSNLLSGRDASQWFVYGTLYTVAILAFGYKFILKYKHNRYQQIRTVSVMFFQLGFAYLIPEFMYVMNNGLPYYDLKSVWPLNYYLFQDYHLGEFLKTGNIGIILIIFGVISTLVITPILTYKYGKRWYCSWVCGCGGLAETAGDSFRHLSTKKMSAWKLERWLIHTVLVFSVIMTVAVVSSFLKGSWIDGVFVEGNYWLSNETFLISVGVFLTVIFAGVMCFKRNELGKDARYGAIGYAVVILSLFIIYFTGINGDIFLIKSSALKSAYGFYIGSIFSGVIGTGFYPILGSRSWCRFGCPMAAILGFQQRLFSKFRITTNGGQCISCGNCSNSCEMGIDVRHYAQKGENIVRSSCVGCGICSAVCPRGVLKLENDSMKGRINPTEVLLGNDVDLMKLVNQK